MRAHNGKNTDNSDAKELVTTLIHELKQAQEKMGISDVEIAERTNVHRATVGRMKRDGDPQLSSFVAVANALGLSLSFQKEASSTAYEPEKIVHRSLSHFRTKGSLADRDVYREKVLSEEWERENTGSVTSPPLLRELVPGYTQDQATAAATAIQWLGSEVGFKFLADALLLSGYEIKSIKDWKP